jgi:hypothetical protein
MSEFSGWRKRQTAKRICSPQAVRRTWPSRTALVSPTARATTKPGRTGAVTGLSVPPCAPSCGPMNTRTGRARTHRLRPVVRSVHPVCRPQDPDPGNDRPLCRTNAPRFKATGTIRAPRRLPRSERDGLDARYREQLCHVGLPQLPSRAHDKETPARCAKEFAWPAAKVAN